MVADSDGVMEPLRDLLGALARTLAAPPAQPAPAGAPGSVDEAWQQVVEAAADQPDGFDLEGDFYVWSGKATSEASVEELGHYLAQLQQGAGT